MNELSTLQLCYNEISSTNVESVIDSRLKDLYSDLRGVLHYRQGGRRARDIEANLSIDFWSPREQDKQEKREECTALAQGRDRHLGARTGELLGPRRTARPRSTRSTVLL